MTLPAPSARARVWYHLPLDALDKAILVGLMLDLVLYSFLLRVMFALGWERGSVAP